MGIYGNWTVTLVMSLCKDHTLAAEGACQVKALTTGLTTWAPPLASSWRKENKFIRTVLHLPRAHCDTRMPTNIHTIGKHKSKEKKEYFKVKTLKRKPHC